MGGIAVLVLFLCITVDTVESLATECAFEQGSDCCHFQIEGGRGGEASCYKGSVWNQAICNCDWPARVSVPCNPQEDCNVVEPAPVVTCPVDLATDQCCINGVIYTIISETQYQQGRAILSCPGDQVFSPHDCCCEGGSSFEAANGKCMYWNFERSVIDSNQNIPLRKAGYASYDSRDGLADRGYYIQLDEMGSLAVDRLAGAYFGLRFSIAFFVRFDGLLNGENRANTIFSNGDEISQNYEEFPPTIFLIANSGDSGKVNLGGGVLTGRQEEIEPFFDIPMDENEWVFITMVYDNNKLRVTAGDEVFEQIQSGQIKSTSCPLMFGGFSLDAGMAIDELLICQETGLTTEQLEAFRDAGTLP